MESLDELSKINPGKPGFFKHVFNFDEESKAEMLNIIQYSVLALIPIIILNKTMQRFVPEADDEKKSLEIALEILAQVVFMFLGIFFIHRIVTYFPTYSGEKYAVWNVIAPIIPMLVIITSLQTKLGEKISILVDRATELWEGSTKEKMTNNKNGNGNVKVSQPISQNQTTMNQSLNSTGSTSINSLPPPQSTMTQQLPNYDQSYQQNSNGTTMENFEPQAANGGFSAFGSAFGDSW